MRLQKFLFFFILSMQLSITSGSEFKIPINYIQSQISIRFPITKNLIIATIELANPVIDTNNPKKLGVTLSFKATSPNSTESGKLRCEAKIFSDKEAKVLRIKEAAITDFESTKSDNSKLIHDILNRYSASLLNNMIIYKFDAVNSTIEQPDNVFLDSDYLIVIYK